MSRLINRAIGAGLLAAAFTFALPVGSRAADDVQTFRQADHGLADALASGDKKAIAALLDDRFQWVEANGKIHTKEQVLDDPA